VTQKSREMKTRFLALAPPARTPLRNQRADWPLGPRGSASRLSSTRPRAPARTSASEPKSDWRWPAVAFGPPRGLAAGPRAPPSRLSSTRPRAPARTSASEPKSGLALACCRIRAPARIGRWDREARPPRLSSPRPRAPHGSPRLRAFTIYRLAADALTETEQTSEAREAPPPRGSPPGGAKGPAAQRA
jgi:hypothetical protein